jgi:predicted transposase YbfD/YdcC
MMQDTLSSLTAVFERIPEGRKAKGRIYPQWLILSLMTLAKLCGYHAYAEMARFVRNHPNLPLLLGFTRPDLPCDDTFRHTLKQLDSESLDEALAQWAQQELVALQASLDEPPSYSAYSADGKTLRGSRDELNGQKAAHLLSLVNQQYHTVIAQQQVAEKRNEISAAKTLFGNMSLAGMVITADALLTQKGLTAVIEQPQGRYLLVLKGNHQQAKELLAEVFREDLPPQAGTTGHQTSEVRKGWFEERSLELVPTSFAVEGFAGVKQVGRLTRYRYHKRSGKEMIETVYLITNLSPEEADAEQVLAWARGHWVIENNLHRTRDVQMQEDASRIRQGHAPRLLATLSNAVIGFLKRRGYDSVKKATEVFRANPSSALELITRAI